VKKLSHATQIIIGAGILVVLLAVYYYFFIRPIQSFLLSPTGIALLAATLLVGFGVVWLRLLLEETRLLRLRSHIVDAIESGSELSEDDEKILDELHRRMA
jgi:hypothetical protein